MSFWTEILREISIGESQRANEIFTLDLPLALRNFSYLDEDRYYQGAIPDMVRAFSAKLPEKERQTAQSRENDLIDYVLDSALKQIKRSIQLLKFCLEFSHYDLKTLAGEFPYWEGYKRDEAHKQKYIADILRSVLEAELKLPENLESIALSKGEAKFVFNETALIKRWNMELTWNDFKRKQEIGGNYKCLDEKSESENPEVYAESLEYDIINLGEAAGNIVEDEHLSYLELKELAAKLTPELETHLEDSHNRKPKHGYRPIAFHKAHWDLMEKYNVIPLRLKVEEPECRTDNDLADHILQNYADVEKPSRQNINERRTKFQRGAEEKIKQRVVEFITIGEI